jgi:hypothetical protein
VIGDVRLFRAGLLDEMARAQRFTRQQLHDLST